MTTQPGPAEIRRWAVMSRNPKAAALFDCAAAWEADRARVESAEQALYATQRECERLIAALKRARALLAKWEAASDEPGPWPRRDTFSECADELAVALKGDVPNG